MRSITPELTKDLLSHFGSNKKVASGEPFLVSTYRELIVHNANLAFLNKDYLLFYRGQCNDYRNKYESSSFYPSIYRGRYLPSRELKYRFDILETASLSLVNLFQKNNIEGFEDVKKRKAVQWSILQHYDVCKTPLLDFTHSLRVACSFATLDDNEEEIGYVYVFGLPYITNRISRNSEHDLINIRLLSICPPTALRPYFQEGYLAGTDEVTTNFDSKSDLDFNNRLIAKFKIPNNDSFWGEGFQKIPRESLYPDCDRIYELCSEITNNTKVVSEVGSFDEFLKSWSELEEKLINMVDNKTNRYLSVQQASRILGETGNLNQEQLYSINRIRKFRNILVHYPKEINREQIKIYLNDIDEILSDLSQQSGIF